MNNNFGFSTAEEAKAFVEAFNAYKPAKRGLGKPCSDIDRYALIEDLLGKVGSLRELFELLDEKYQLTDWEWGVAVFAVAPEIAKRVNPKPGVLKP